MKSILLVDDEPSLVNALRDKLNHLGFNITLAKNGLVALNLLAVAEYDLVILDMVMPVMSGLHFLDELDKLGIKVPVIGLSNNSNGIMVEAMKKGVIKYFIKSDVSLREIANYVLQLLTKVDETKST